MKRAIGFGFVVCGLGILAALGEVRGEEKGTATQAAAVSQPAAVDLKENVLVQRALADHEKALADIDADYAKKLDALKAEKQKKMDAAKVATLAALRRAEAVSVARNRKEEGLTIRALAESFEKEGVKTDRKVEGKKEATQTPAGKETQKEKAKSLAGRWVNKSGSVTIMNADGTCEYPANGNTGTWQANKEGTAVELKWKEKGWSEVMKLEDGRWMKQIYVNGKEWGMQEMKRE